MHDYYRSEQPFALGALSLLGGALVDLLTWPLRFTRDLVRLTGWAPWLRPLDEWTGIPEAFQPRYFVPQVCSIPQVYPFRRAMHFFWFGRILSFERILTRTEHVAWNELGEAAREARQAGRVRRGLKPGL